jgi:hypothetical protein
MFAQAVRQHDKPRSRQVVFISICGVQSHSRGTLLVVRQLLRGNERDNALGIFRKSPLIVPLSGGMIVQPINWKGNE